LYPHNVRLVLVANGFKTFAKMSTTYRICPMLLVPYNLSPWLCMKQENIILLIVIPKPDSYVDAGDVYLQQLVEEFNALWEVG